MPRRPSPATTAVHPSAAGRKRIWRRSATTLEHWGRRSNEYVTMLNHARACRDPNLGRAADDVARATSGTTSAATSSISGERRPESPHGQIERDRLLGLTGPAVLAVPGIRRLSFRNRNWGRPRRQRSVSSRFPRLPAPQRRTDCVLPRGHVPEGLLPVLGGARFVAPTALAFPARARWILDDRRGLTDARVYHTATTLQTVRSWSPAETARAAISTQALHPVAIRLCCTSFSYVLLLVRGAWQRAGERCGW